MIQAIIRGLLTRGWVKIWNEKRLFYIIYCQSHLRRREQSRKWVVLKEKERICVIVIQCAVRRFLASVAISHLRDNRAAKRIQVTFRGWNGRQHYTTMKKYSYAVVIQSQIRRLLSIKQLIRIRETMTESALRISRCWRGHLARKAQIKILHGRDLRRREDHIRMLKSELECLRELSTKLKSNTDRKSLKNEAMPKLEKISSLTKLEKDLNQKEANYLELKGINSNMSLRLVQQGWKEQSKKNLVEARKDITTTKLEIVFRVHQASRKEENEAKQSNGWVQDVEARTTNLQKWIDESQEDLWSSQRQQDATRREILVRQVVADEKRKWKIKHKLVNRKRVNKLKDISSPTVCMTATDLMAYSVVGSTKNSSERIHKLIDMIQLCLYKNQVKQNSTVFKPVEVLPVGR